MIYRELFPMGLSLLDLTDAGSGVAFTMSHVAARQEIRDIMIVLKLPGPRRPGNELLALLRSLRYAFGMAKKPAAKCRFEESPPEGRESDRSMTLNVNAPGKTYPARRGEVSRRPARPF